jgi:hypothetical protein
MTFVIVLAVINLNPAIATRGALEKFSNGEASSKAAYA